MDRQRRARSVASLFLIACVAAVSPTASAQAAEAPRVRTAPWPSAILDEVARIPVQEGGRIKPLSSFAGFQMLGINGKRTYKTDWGEKLGPTAFLLDCWFYPEQAKHYRVITVDDARALESVGLDTAGKNRRDRYSMAEIEPVLIKLGRQGRALSQKETSRRTALESQILAIAGRASRLKYMLGFLDFARARIPVKGTPLLPDVFPNRNDVRFLELIERFPEVSARRRPDKPEQTRVLYDRVAEILDAATLVSFLAPEDPKNETYRSPENVLGEVLRGERADGEMALLRRFEAIVDQRGDQAQLSAGLTALQRDLVARAETRGEYGRIGLEVGFYKADWLYRALYCFLFGFLLCCVRWLKPMRFLYGGAWGLVSIGGILLIVGIVLRCMIRGRPPITTPYEAILFIIAVGVIITLFMESTRRTGLPLVFASVIGALGMMLAQWHERVEGVDTMQPLVAVLDTNFWLATHVTTVTLGYCGGMVAALIAHVYIFGKLLGFKRNEPAFYRDLSKMIYGVLCFGLLFAVVGTILGGVWANDSWGRFWGWDPKENGALMLCLGYLAILHARLGGHLREHGIAVASVLLGIIVMWAFWGVNLYQVGLHSYGFTETKAQATQLYYMVEACVAGLGVLAWWLPRNRVKRRPAA